MDAFQKHDTNWKKVHKKDCVLYDFIYMKVQKSQGHSNKCRSAITRCLS